MDIRKYKIIKKDKPTTDRVCLFVSPADGTLPSQFKAGQFAMIHLLDTEGNSLGKRAYSLASAPAESNQALEFCIKGQGDFSNNLCALEEGQVLGVQMPFGVFTLDHAQSQIVYFAGGVGITPLRSQIRQSLASGLDQIVYLFYSGRNLDDLVYHQELVELGSIHPNFKYIPILTRDCPPGWTGHCGRLDKQLVKASVSDLTVGEFLMCGPAPFMDGVKSILTDLGVDVQKRLRFERY